MGSHIFLLVGCSCTNTFVPGRTTTRFLLWSKFWFSIPSADRCGFMQDGCRRLRVVVSNGNILHHRWRGIFISTVVRPVIKWSFIVLMSFSVLFVQCIFSGTICSSISLLYNYCLTILGHSLSIMWIFGFMPLFLKCV